ncbi:MAG: anti-sigma factor family protein [Armatimonadota bacterium]
MACSEGRQLAAYLDAELSLPDRARLEEHLRHCAACRQEIAELEQLEGLLAELSPVPTPPQLLSCTMARARGELQPTRRMSANRPAAVGAAAALLLVLLQFGLYSPSTPVQHQAVAFLEPAPQLSTAVSLPPAPRQAVRLAAEPARVSRRPKSNPRIAYRPAKIQPKPLTAAPPPQSLEVVAAAAYQEASGHAARDPELSVAALENVAAAYPRSRQAAKALLAAGSLERRCGNLTEADVAYRRVLALPAQTGLTQGLAHKALGDMRRECVGDDEVALYHYQQAARALREETSRRTGPRTQALVVLADVERQMGHRERAAADYATLANADLKSTLAEQTTAALAEVL